MDYLVVQMRTSYFEYYTHQTMYRAIGISVHTPSQSKLQVFHVEGQTGNSLSPPGSTGNIITEFRFYNLMIEDPWRLQSQRKESCDILYGETCLPIHSLRASCCFRRGECHDPGLGPVLGSMCWACMLFFVLGWAHSELAHVSHVYVFVDETRNNLSMRA